VRRAIEWLILIMIITLAILVCRVDITLGG
jgi:hypothetical protein